MKKTVERNHKMSYSLKKANYSNSFLTKLKIKIGKLLSQHFPLNKIRIFGLKLCGFEVGAQVYLGSDLIVTSDISEETCTLIIEDRVAIAPRVTIILSSDANWSRLMEKMEYIKGKVVLCKDCWIGAGAIIMPNIIIGECSIVGAGSVVTKNVPAFTIVAGIPAREIKRINPCDVNLNNKENL